MIEIPCFIDDSLARSQLLLDYIDRRLRAFHLTSRIRRCDIETWSLGILRVSHDYFLGGEGFRLVYAPSMKKQNLSPT